MFLLCLMLIFDEPLLSGQPLLRGHWPFPQGWPLKRSSTVAAWVQVIGIQLHFMQFCLFFFLRSWNNYEEITSDWRMKTALYYGLLVKYRQWNHRSRLWCTEIFIYLAAVELFLLTDLVKWTAAILPGQICHMEGLDSAWNKAYCRSLFNGHEWWLLTVERFINLMDDILWFV